MFSSLREAPAKSTGTRRSIHANIGAAWFQYLDVCGADWSLTHISYAALLGAHAGIEMLGCDCISSRAVYGNPPEDRRVKRQRIERMRQALPNALAEQPVPPLADLSRRLGYPHTAVLWRNHSDLCHQIMARFESLLRSARLIWRR